MVEKNEEKILFDDLDFDTRLELFNNLTQCPPKTPRRIFKKSNSKQPQPISFYKCDLCGKVFDQELQYFGHLQSHSGERQWKCDKCSHTPFPNQSQLHSHERQVHFIERKCRCPEPGCSVQYDRPSQLEYHIRRYHSRERKFSCRLCTKSFFTATDLRSHVNIHLGINKKVCDICGRTFNHISNFLRHKRRHLGIKNYQCHDCDRKFNELNGLRAHQLTHQKSNPKSAINIKPKRQYYCSLCGLTFPFMQSLRQHEVDHENQKNVTCKTCNQTFELMSQYKGHTCKNAQHIIKELEVEKSLVLDIENINYDSNPSPNANVNSAWNNIINDLLAELNIEPDSRTDCDNFELNVLNTDVLKDSEVNLFCDLKTDKPLETSPEKIIEEKPKEAENLEVKILNNKTIHQCHLCNATFAHKTSLHRHIKRHNLEKTECHLCGKEMTQLSLSTHIRRIHNQERNVVCGFEGCGKIFFKQADLVLHERTHTKERPFFCQICGKSFTCSSHQLRHEKIHNRNK